MNSQNHGSTVEVVTRYKRDERKRWNRRVTSLIFVGLLISVLIHLNIGFLLSFLTKGGFGDESASKGTEIQFAVLDADELSDLPQSDLTSSQESAPSQATETIVETTQATLTAEATTTALEASSASMTPSLAGGGSAGMGTGMGGSGGGGTSFFGISSSGSRFCYIVDISGSMREESRLPTAMNELSKSLKKLPDFAKFYILFYSNAVTEPSFQRGWNTARKSTIRKMIAELATIRAGGGTEPKDAFVQALALTPAPEVIFFLTDGVIAGFTTDELKTMLPRRDRVVINTIAFGTDSSQQLLRDISKLTGGKFNFVKSRVAP